MREKHVTWICRGLQLGIWALCLLVRQPVEEKVKQCFPKDWKQVLGHLKHFMILILCLVDSEVGWGEDIEGLSGSLLTSSSRLPT
ncbi:hypothetical protein K2173_003805 [Erythroxylum novogranatense]|uniref:Uncharacterized protein n=1 Tax=Erythroxylum novogranatense TaxID=1862640 RepID=A0AAV8SIU9_9ROSI|nr:hypothetical protein K2173_003805 [Erythroxylum novogranatense]